MAPPPAIPASALAQAQHVLLQAAYHDDLYRFKVLAELMNKGRGSLRKTVEAARQEGVPGMESGGVLHVAAGNGSMVVCRYLVEKLKMDVDDRDKEGSTPLVSAIHSGNVGTVKYLLDHGANQDNASRGGLTPLHSAAGLGECEMMKVLLARGAYVDPLSTCGTPLHLATTEGNDGAVKILLDHNADYNKMVFGLSPIFIAVNAASEKCVKLLLEAGADVNGDYVLTALTDAANSGPSDCLHCLLEGVGTNHHVPDDRSIWRKRSAPELKALGSLAFERKNYLYAAGFYSKAMDLDPDDATLFSNRSLCWLRAGHGGKALLDADECRKKRPDWPKAFYRLGSSLMSLKDYKSACDALFDGLKLDPENTEIGTALRWCNRSGERMQKNRRYPTRQSPAPRRPFLLQHLSPQGQGGGCLLQDDWRCTALLAPCHTIAVHMARRGCQVNISCDCCKQFSDHLDGKMKCFFSHMTTNFRHSVSIPDRFMNHFGGNISGTIELESPNGNVYDVEVNKHRNKTILGYGWKTFVDAHHIEENDYVMFSYSGSSCFSILIFDSSGCEKVFSCAGNKTACNLEEGDGDSGEGLNSSGDPNTQYSESERGSSPRRKKTNNKTASYEESGEDSPSEYGSIQSDHLKSSMKHDHVLSSRCYPTEEQQEKIDALTEEIQSETPLLVTQMKRSNVDGRPTLVIHKNYARTHFPRKSQNIKLMRPGVHKEWYSKLNVRKDERGFTLNGRWSEFVLDNNLQEKDICLIEPIKGENMFTLMIHLLDKASTPSRNGRSGMKGTPTSHVKEESGTKKSRSLSLEHSGHRVSQDRRHTFDDYQGGPSEPPLFLLLGNARLTPVQEKIVEENVKAIQSELSIYVAPMDKSTVSGDTFALDFGTRNVAVHVPGGQHTLTLRQVGWRNKLWRAEMNDRRVLAGDRE